MNKQIQEYFEKYKDQYDKNDLIGQLKKAGYSENDIHEVVKITYIDDRQEEFLSDTQHATQAKRGKFAMSWSLLKSSFTLLNYDKEILWFPVISSIVSILVFIGLIIPLGLVFGIADFFASEGAVPYTGYILLFLYYLIGTFIVAFFNSALISCIMKRLQGGDPTVKSGLQAALTHKKEIFIWALISATIGLILRVILDTLSNRLGVIGQMISSTIVGLIGVIWGIATYFVVPVIIIEGVKAKDAIRISADLFKKTWGENLIGNISLGIFFVIALIPILILSIVMMFTFKTILGYILGASLLGVSFIIVAILSSTLNAIFRAVLYLYAKTGEVPEVFEKDVLSQAFTIKSKKQGLFSK